MSTINEEVIAHLRKMNNKQVRKRQERLAQAITVLKQAKLPISESNIEIVSRRLGAIEKRILLGIPFDINILEGLEGTEENP